MKNMIVRALVVLATATTMSVGVGVGTAHASCANANRLFALNPANSAVFAANSGCDGLWANYPTLHTDRVRGQYYVNGTGWEQSSYGWQLVSYTSSPNIIGNTVTVRVLRGESETYRQDINVKY